MHVHINSPGTLRRAVIGEMKVSRIYGFIKHARVQ